MKKLNHPGVIRFIETIQTDKHFCLIQEYASGGDLFELISNRTKVFRNQNIIIL